MDTDHQLRSSGAILIIAGILFGGFMFFHPPNNPQGAFEIRWVPVHMAWFISYLLMVVSFIPLYHPISTSGSNLETTAFWITFLGNALSLPIAAWDAFIVPYLAKHAPDFITQMEELSMEAPAVSFRIIVYLAILLYSIGFILFGFSMIRSRRALKIISGICLAVGAPVFWIGALIVSSGPLGNMVTIIGSVLFGVGLIIWGSQLYSGSYAYPGE